MTGVAGRRGPLGAKGAKGVSGSQGSSVDHSGFLFTKHSQSVLVPECPAGSTKMYSGYSLLFINGNNRAHGQDLGNMTPNCFTLVVLCCISTSVRVPSST